MSATTNWAEAIRPLIKKYQKKKHPLDYQNIYQLIVMVVLSAQSTDIVINKLAPGLFKAFPGMPALSKATVAKLSPYIHGVRNFGNKADWLIQIAKKIKKDLRIPQRHMTTPIPINSDWTETTLFSRGIQLNRLCHYFTT